MGFKLLPELLLLLLHLFLQHLVEFLFAYGLLGLLGQVELLNDGILFLGH